MTASVTATTVPSVTRPPWFADLVTTRMALIDHAAAASFLGVARLTFLVARFAPGSSACHSRRPVMWWPVSA